MYYILCSMAWDVVPHTSQSHCNVFRVWHRSACVPRTETQWSVPLAVKAVPLHLWMYVLHPMFHGLLCGLPHTSQSHCNVFRVLHRSPCIPRTDIQCSVPLAVPLHLGMYILHPMFHGLGCGLPHTSQSHWNVLRVWQHSACVPWMDTQCSVPLAIPL